MIFSQHLKPLFNYSSWLFFFLFFPVLSFSQTKARQDSVSKIPRVLTIPEIQKFEFKTRHLSDDVVTLLNDKDELLRIKEDLGNYDSILNNKLLLLRDTLSNFNLDKLDRLEDEITVFNNRAEPWKRKVERWKSRTGTLAKRIEFNYFTWQITADSILSADERLADTDSVKREKLNFVKTKVRSELDKLTDLTTDFLSWDTLLNDVSNSLGVSIGVNREAFSLISSKRKKSLDNLWIPEHNAIWKMNSEFTPGVNQISLKDELKVKTERIIEYLKGNSDFFYTLLFSFFLILSLVIYIKIKSRKLYNSETQDLIRDNTVIKYPVFSSFIILNFVVFLFLDIPAELESAVLLISILPFSLLLWKLNPENWLINISIFIISSLIFIFLPVLSEQQINLRYTLLVVNATEILLLLILQRNKELVEKENSYWLGTLPFMISLFIFLSSIALIANIIGSVQLSLILTRTVLGTFIVFLIIKESVILFESFLFLILMGPLYKFSNILKEDGAIVLRSIHRILRIIAFALWIYVILDLLKVREVFFDSFVKFITKPLKVGELNISLGNIIAFFLILQVSVWISQFIRYFLDKEVYPRTSLSEGVSGTFSLMIKYTITFFGFILALFGAGIELSKVAVGIGALGVGIGFGLQNIVNNFVSGVILALERPIKIGDKVKVDDVEGTVMDIGLRASQIKTWDGSDVLVPNGSLISGKLTNYTLSDKKRRLNLEVNLSADADVEKASEVILQAVAQVPAILKKPGPYLNFVGIKEGKSIIDVYAWISNYSDGFSTGTAFKIAVYNALRKEGFEISIPVMDIQVNQKYLGQKK